MKLSRIFMLVLSVFFLHACADKSDPADITDLNQPATSVSDASTKNDTAAFDLNTDTHVYFKKNSSYLSQKYLPMLNAHAAYMKTHPEVQISLMSYTDKQGDLKYNKKLAMRRAQAVANELETDGVNMSRIRVIDYGELPDQGNGSSDDAARRVDLLYDEVNP
jgi:outer membrane protein OmpA-like peptidoglycan-associated protein